MRGDAVGHCQPLAAPHLLGHALDELVGSKGSAKDGPPGVLAEGQRRLGVLELLGGVIVQRALVHPVEVEPVQESGGLAVPGYIALDRSHRLTARRRSLARLRQIRVGIRGEHGVPAQVASLVRRPMRLSDRVLISPLRVLGRTVNNDLGRLARRRAVGFQIFGQLLLHELRRRALLPLRHP